MPLLGASTGAWFSRICGLPGLDRCSDGLVRSVPGIRSTVPVGGAAVLKSVLSLGTEDG